jgi:hypothetical protein
LISLELYLSLVARELVLSIIISIESLRGE